MDKGNYVVTWDLWDLCGILWCPERKMFIFSYVEKDSIEKKEETSARGRNVVPDFPRLIFKFTDREKGKRYFRHDGEAR